MTREERIQFVISEFFALHNRTMFDAAVVIVDAWENEIEESIDDAFQRGIWAEQETHGA